MSRSFRIRKTLALLAIVAGAAHAAESVDPVSPVVVPSPPSSSPAGGPAIELRLTGTLDLSHDACGSETQFAVPKGTDVRFCYWAGNTGTTTFELHDLADMDGVVFTDLPVELQPGFAIFLMQNRQPMMNGANLATWTATGPGAGNEATGTDSTPLAILPPVVGCNLGSTTFSHGIPLGWTSFDWLAMAALPDSEVDWAPLGPAGCLESGNWTGGRGGAACASSSFAGAEAYDTQLRTHGFSLAGVTHARAEFRLNYQDAAAAGDALAVDISLDGGDTWESVALSSAASYGSFRSLPGAAISLALDAWAGEPDVRLGIRYVNHAGAAHDLYAQMDDFSILCDGGLFFDGFESGDTDAWAEDGD